MSLNEKIDDDRTLELSNLEQGSSNAASALNTEPPAAKDAPQNTSYLDGLRGLAALCVFNQHLIGGGRHEQGFGQEGNYQIISFPFIRTFYNGGSAAVAIFFVLSGFVLSRTTLKLFRSGKLQASKMSLISAVVRRPIRLYFAAAGATLCVALAMHLPYNIYPGMPFQVAKDTIFGEIRNWAYECVKFFNPFQHHGSDQAWFPYNLVMWTLPAEYKGSMLIYFALPIWCYGFGIQLWSVGLLLLVAMIGLQLGSYLVGCFFFGMVLSMVDLYGFDKTYALNRLTPKHRNIAIHVIWVIGYYLLSQPAVAGRPEWAENTPGYHLLTVWRPKAYNAEGYYRFWQSYGAFLFTYATLNMPWFQKFLGSRPLRFLGKVSFMLYVLHLPLFIGIINRTSRIFGQIPGPGQDMFWDNWLFIPDVGPKGLSTRWIVLWLSALAITLPISDLATRFIDEPCVKLGKAISGRLGLDPPRQEADRRVP